MAAVIADTHALIWYLFDSPRLSDIALARFQKCEETGDAVGVASISITEMVYLTEKGRIPAEALPRLQEHLARESAMFEVIPLTYDSALAVQKVPRTQVPDLPDRIIAATALHLGVPLISRDRRIRAASVETIW